MSRSAELWYSFTEGIALPSLSFGDVLLGIGPSLWQVSIVGKAVLSTLLFWFNEVMLQFRPDFACEKEFWILSYSLVVASTEHARVIWALELREFVLCNTAL